MLNNMKVAFPKYISINRPQIGIVSMHSQNTVITPAPGRKKPFLKLCHPSGSGLNLRYTRKLSVRGVWLLRLMFGTQHVKRLKC